MMQRRSFMGAVAGGAAGIALDVPRLRLNAANPVAPGIRISHVEQGEDIFAYMRRSAGRPSTEVYKRILGAANEFKEGDQIVGVAAADHSSRQNARRLLANTTLRDINSYPLHNDQLHQLLQRDLDSHASRNTSHLTVGRLKSFLLANDESSIKSVMQGLSSATIACVVKLMSDPELIQVGSKVFNPLPGSKIGARGFLGARIQPNSPTDNLDDIRWQVFDGWSFAVGDVLLGTNPVSSEVHSVAAIEKALQDLLVTFEIDDAMPHCVLSHIDVQAQVEREHPGRTALWFQSIAGSDAANKTFDISIEKMIDYAASRSGRFGMYFETGQGADATNGHSHGFDMVIHESRKYGFARALTRVVAEAQVRAATNYQPWVHLNDVAGFIGPEVFRTREQLVRCCLEDIVMGKLHGLCLGLDVCSTLHMDVSLSDLDWCLEQVMPANPAYLMALPTKIDPMLGYLTTGFQDHVRLREKFGYQVNPRIWRFFQELGILDSGGQPTEHFGDPIWVYRQYCRRKGDTRRDDEIYAEGQSRMREVRGRGVFLATGRGQRAWDLHPELKQEIQHIFEDAKESIWEELKPSFIRGIPNSLPLATRSVNRSDYILHPDSGEQLADAARDAVRQLRQVHAGIYDVQIVVSDGLNALAIMDDGHLEPYLRGLRSALLSEGFRTAPEHIVLKSGRVRAGYRIGEALFANMTGHRAILHVIGERPGTGHHTFSIYITAPQGSVWGNAGKVDHNITKVVSGVASTALAPSIAADDTLRILKSLI